MLPFRKKADEAAASGPVETQVRKSDESEDYSLMDACAEDLMQAIETKDIKLLKEALESLVEHLRSMDEEQDEGME